MSKKPLFITLSIIVIISLLWIMPALNPAEAAAPDNDEFKNAKVITGLPFSDVVDTTEATSNPLDPNPSAEGKSVWYRFTPATNMNVLYDGTKSNYANALGIYTGDYALGLTQVSIYSNLAPLYAGITYYFMIVQVPSPYPLPEGERAKLNFNIVQKPGPENDFFADATPIESLPYSTTVNLNGAFVENGEPTPPRGFYYCTNTVWYKFTPVTETVIYGTAYSNFPKAGFIFKGDSYLDAEYDWLLAGNYESFAVEVSPGQTYYFQLCSYDENDIEFPLYLTEKPLVMPGFYTHPSDPHSGEIVEFCDLSYGFNEEKMIYHWWDLGDGTTLESADPCVKHEFSEDRDYFIWHKVQPDTGVAAEMGETITVQSHDVGISYLKTPYWIRIGNTYQFHVGINSQFAQEIVWIDLYLLTRSGKKNIGYQSYAWISPWNGTVDILFEYTFTDEDVKNGLVIFEAILYLGRYRDRYEYNNKANSFPVLVLDPPDDDPAWNLFLPIINTKQ
jgi:hypothetical protein